MTLAEKALWFALKRGAIPELKFRHQVPVGRYIADFLCYERSLIVEIDGPIHALQADYDLMRDDELRRRGYRVLRVSNNNIFDNLSQTLESIRTAAMTPLGKPFVDRKSFPLPGMENGRREGG